MPQIFAAMTVAGSDSGGGAGIQADLKTFSALGVYGASALTAVTAQNTRAVTEVELLRPALVAAQIAAVLDDIRIHAIKIGMLGSADIVTAVTEALAGYSGPVVLDPVMIAKSGDALLAAPAIEALRDRLLPRAEVLTPNLPEAARLLGAQPATTLAEAEAQGRALLALGPGAVVMKGGHAEGSTCTDLVVTKAATFRIETPRIATANTHGTGCSLSAAIAAEMAKGAPLRAAVERAQAWLHEAIRAADDLRIGGGHGPVHHFHEVWR